MKLSRYWEKLAFVVDDLRVFLKTLFSKLPET